MVDGSLICSNSCIEALPIHGKLRNTGKLPGRNFGLVENFRHLHVMLLVICPLGIHFSTKFFFYKIKFMNKFWSGAYHKARLLFAIISWSILIPICCL